MIVATGGITTAATGKAGIYASNRILFPVIIFYIIRESLFPG
jgi:hypothetical protein